MLTTGYLEYTNMHLIIHVTYLVLHKVKLKLFDKTWEFLQAIICLCVSLMHGHYFAHAMPM